jgi:protein-tyrosine phosphatase
MAEFIMKHLVAQAGRTADFEIASAAVSTEEIGNDIYPPAKRMLAARNVPFEHRTARQMTRADYAYYDHIVCMDQSNLRWLRYIIGEDTDHKASLLKQWSNDQINEPYGEADRSKRKEMVNDNMVNISDPWYTGDFTKAYDDILEGCQGMLQQI